MAAKTRKLPEVPTETFDRIMRTSMQYADRALKVPIEKLAQNMVNRR
jgi:hypothetical protein